jgi:enoyl-[acyl-carrier-protein] reductase (NADH)
MRKEMVFLAILLGAAIVMVSGCLVAAVGVGAGTVAYVRCDMETVEPAGIDAVYKAAEKAVDNLGLRGIEKTKDELTAKIKARDSEDKKVTIRLTSAGRMSTKLSIRIGTFGDEIKSRRIYEEIKKYL